MRVTDEVQGFYYSMNVCEKRLLLCTVIIYIFGTASESLVLCESVIASLTNLWRWTESDAEHSVKQREQ